MKVLIGKILRPRGLKGEIKAAILTNKYEVFNAVKKIFIDSEYKEFNVIKSSVQNGFAYLILDGVNHIDKAERFRDKEIFISAKDMNLKDGEVLSSDLIGFDVLNAKRERIGTLRAVENYGGGVFFEIAVTQAGFIQIPNEDEFILETNMTDKTVTLSDKALDAETVL